MSGVPGFVGQAKSLLARIPVRLRILALFFILSLNHLHPILKNFFSKLPYATIGDVSLTLAILQANMQKLSLLQFAQLYHLPFLFPLSNTLTIGFTMFGQSVLLLPLFLIGVPNIYALYNGLVFCSYLAAGYGAFLFFRELQDNDRVALIAASLYVLLPFRVYNIPHLNLLLNFPIPFSWLFLLKYMKHGRKKDLLLLNAFLLAQFLFDLSHGFFLSISLALLVAIHVMIQRPIPLRTLFKLFLSLLPTMAIVLLIHIPFLQKDAALSQYRPSFDPSQYHPALGFYANKSTLLLLSQRLWDPWPFFPGFSVVFFYFFAFSRYVQGWRDRILLAFTVGAYAVPGLIAVVFFRKQDFSRINSLAEIGIVAFFASLAALLFFLRKQIPPALKLISMSLLAVTFITFAPFPRIFDLFDALARFLPFLHRSRGLRTSYILPLAILGVFAFGLKSFLEKKEGKKAWLWAVVLLLLVEHWRWPVEMAKLPEPDGVTRGIYRMTDPYPPHFGIIELPFVPTASNMYPLFSQYHHKHTYHGHYLNYDDPLLLGDEAALRVEKGMIGLTDPDLLDKLKANGLYLVLLSESFIRHIHDGNDIPVLWRRIRLHVKNGLAAGLYKEVKEERHALLIVLDDSRTGQDVTYPVPYFALAGKTAVHFTIRTRHPVRSRIFFNERLVATMENPAGEERVSLTLPAASINRQVNRIRIASDQPITASDWRIQ